MKKVMCVAIALALSTVVFGCKKEEKPEEKAANAVSKMAESAKGTVNDANKAVQDAVKK